MKLLYRPSLQSFNIHIPFLHHPNNVCNSKTACTTRSKRHHLMTLTVRKNILVKNSHNSLNFQGIVTKVIHISRFKFRVPTKSGLYETSGIKVSVYQVIEIRKNNFSFFQLKHFQIHCLEAPSSITYNHKNNYKPTKLFCLYVNMTLMYNNNF